MSKAPLVVVAAIVFTLTPLAVQAQTAAKPAQPAGKARVHQEPCWQQAGISQDAKQQRDQIALDRREQIQAVCADSSLNPQEKKQKIKEIRQQAKEKIDSVISADQEQQLTACQKERAANAGHPAASAGQHPGAGPCGEVAASGNPPAPAGNENHPDQNRPAPQ